MRVATESFVETQFLTSKAINITKYAPGSLSELCVLVFPLMLSSLSGTIMVLTDRLVLAGYSTQAMNAIASASLIFAILQFTSISITSIAEVFVGQYNGAKQYHRLAQPVWQMIWFSLMTIVPFFLVGLFGCDLILPNEMHELGKPFLSTLMYFGPLFPLNAALASFFVGQGKVKLVTISIIVTSFINLLLLFILVFGFQAIPPLGTFGAALATGIAQFFGLLILGIAFLSRENRLKYKTHYWQFDATLFKQCLKVGLPNSIGHMVATIAWSLVMILLTKTSQDHITIFTIFQTIWQFFAFITDGYQKAITTICANLIGANKRKYIHKVLNSGIYLHLMISLFLLIPLVLFPDYFIQGFLSDHFESAQFTLFETAKASSQILWISLVLEGIVWIISGILTAAGDTRFIMLINAVNAWAFGIVPFYLLMGVFTSPPIVSIYIIVAFSLVNLLSFILRFKGKSWQQKPVLIPNAY